MKRIVPVVALAVLLQPVTADGKGTNVRTSSAPNGTDAGEPWATLITITAPHPKEPVVGLSPKVIIRMGSEREAFRAVPTAERGVYRAVVVFPSRGTWSYGVDDGMDQVEPGLGLVHRFPPVTIAAGQAEVETPPLPISGEVSEGEVPPETYVAPGSQDDQDEGDENAALFPVLAFMLAAAIAGPVWLRRRRRR